MLVRFLHPHPLGDHLGVDAAEGAEEDLPEQLARALIGEGIAEPVDADAFEAAPPAKPKPKPRREAAARKGAPERAVTASPTKRG